MDFNPFLLAMVEYISSSENTSKISFNPKLKNWEAPSPNNVAGKGQIEEPGQMSNIVWQTRLAAPTEYENALGDALEKVFGDGAEALEQVVEGLNGIGFRMPDGRPWTAASFESEMARLGH